MPLHRRNPRLFALATCEDCKVPSNLRGSPGLMTAGLRIAHGSCKLCQIGIPTVSGTRSHRVLLRVVVAFPDLHLRSTSGMHRCQFRTALSCVSSFPMPRSCALPCKFKELGARRHKPPQPCTCTLLILVAKEIQPIDSRQSRGVGDFRCMQNPSLFHRGRPEGAGDDQQGNWHWGRLAGGDSGG